MSQAGAKEQYIMLQTSRIMKTKRVLCAGLSAPVPYPVPYAGDGHVQADDKEGYPFAGHGLKVEACDNGLDHYCI